MLAHRLRRASRRGPSFGFQYTADFFSGAASGGTFTFSNAPLGAAGMKTALVTVMIEDSGAIPDANYLMGVDLASTPMTLLTKTRVNSTYIVGMFWLETSLATADVDVKINTFVTINSMRVHVGVFDAQGLTVHSSDGATATSGSPTVAVDRFTNGVLVAHQLGVSASHSQDSPVTFSLSGEEVTTQDTSGGALWVGLGSGALKSSDPGTLTSSIAQSSSYLWALQYAVVKK